MQNEIPKTSGDDLLISLGQQFECLFEEFLRLSHQASIAVNECEQRLATFMVPVGSKRWLRLRDEGCGAILQAMNDKAAEADAVSNKIRRTKATTVAGLMVKAKCLPFDMSATGDATIPRHEWDWEVECLYNFIDEVESMAFGRAG